MPSTEKSVRVFISSTFRDMHAERHHLVTVVFPELRERVELLGLEFFDVDLRFRLRPDGAVRRDYGGQGSVSQRYGWVPKPGHFREAADRQRQEQERRSIGNLEVRHAVLDQRRKRRGFFHLRYTPVGVFHQVTDVTETFTCQ